MTKKDFGEDIFKIKLDIDKINQAQGWSRLAVDYHEREITVIKEKISALVEYLNVEFDVVPPRGEEVIARKRMKREE